MRQSLINRPTRPNFSLQVKRIKRDISGVILLDKPLGFSSNQALQKIWRAPGGKTSPPLIRMGDMCGYQHISWAPAGFLGDELNSDKYPNQTLLEKASKGIQDGDITMAHLGIWSRKDPWAPAVLEQLIVNLKQRGFCFGLLPKNSENQSK